MEGETTVKSNALILRKELVNFQKFDILEEQTHKGKMKAFNNFIGI